MIATLSFTFASLRTEIQRHLSVIGKRFYDNEAINRFSRITLSTNEVQILDEYIITAAHTAIANIQRFVNNYTEDTTAISFNVQNQRWQSATYPDTVNTFKKAFSKFLVLSALADYIDMNFHDFARKYYDDAQRQLATIIALVWYKVPPVDNQGNDSSPEVLPTLTFSPTNISAEGEDPVYVFQIPAGTFTSYDIVTVSCSNDDVEIACYIGNTVLFTFTNLHTFTEAERNTIASSAVTFANAPSEPDADPGTPIASTDTLSIAYRPATNEEPTSP